MTDLIRFEDIKDDDSIDLSKRREIREKFLAEGLKTGFLQFDDHNGFQPGCVHTLIARLSSGKSSVVRSLIRNLTLKHKILVMCTEETLEQFIFGLGNMDDDEANIIQNNIKYISESEFLKAHTSTNYFQILKNRIKKHNPVLYVYDNITTSSYYNALKPNDQTIFVQGLRDISRETKIPFFIIAHVEKNVRNNDFTFESIRGCQTIALNSEFGYTLHTDKFEYTVGNTTYSELITVSKTWKARFSSKSMLKTYSLHYNKERNLFDYQTSIDEQEFNKIVKPQRKKDAKSTSDTIRSNDLQSTNQESRSSDQDNRGTNTGFQF